MDPAHPRFCSLFAARSLYPQAPRHRLAAMLEFLALPGVNSHNAIDDVRATVGLVRRMADDFRRNRGEAEAVLERHAALFRRFTDSFKPLWESFQERRGGKWRFADLFARWRERLEREFPAYPRTHLEEVRRKIVRHMEHTSRPAPLPVLLRRHLPRYALYREPDLILDEDRLVVSTVHRAKGLEFDRVIVPFCVDGRFPLFMAKTDEARQEEARLLYVACTRARRGLIISWHRSHRGRETALSPCIAPLEKEHFRCYEITRAHFRPAARPFRCPRCGHRFLHDGSRQQNRRCFECGHTPEEGE
jgi:DNA helicase-2/ATP-dependent DNA helicase PcrA